MNKGTNSVLVKDQAKTYRGEWIDGDGEHVVIASVRHDDRCGNGHNTFSITGTVYGRHGHPRDGTEKHSNGRAVYCESSGCVHEVIAAHIPELSRFIKWHLCSTVEPMHYIENAVYMAGDRDHWGLRAGEVRQHLSRGDQNGGVPGVPLWELDIPERVAREIYAEECPAPVVCRWVPNGITGEGKARDFAAARRAAVWPEATDEELSQEPGALRAALAARLPGLMAEFRKDVESLGFVY
jgi:hypothetical protein